jgi:1-acyl-sn-glycerol-3-phosphate acyltransferase
MTDTDRVVIPFADEFRMRPAGDPPAPHSAAVLPFPRPRPPASGYAAVRAVLARRARGEETVDEFGFDRELTAALTLPAVRAVYERWFRVEVSGVADVPDEGGALLVANHAGGLAPWDAVMTAVAVHDEHPRHRWLRPLGADLLFGTPGLGRLARRSGATRAHADDAERLLRAGELVGVWPEGFRGTGKPFRDRYRLQRFGRGGFVRLACAAGVPIVPVAIVGAEEIHPVLANLTPVARALRLPYFPVTPTFPWLGPLGLVPLPSKWHIHFGAPVWVADCAANDSEAVAGMAARIRDSIQADVDRLRAERRSVWR